MYYTPYNISVSIISVAIGAIAFEMSRFRSSTFGTVYWHGQRNSSRYALTFDDGPTEPYTSQMLDVLDQHDAKATFFVIGQNIERCPQVLRRMDAAGHLIANHSFDHSHIGMLRLNRYWRDQLARTDAAIESIIGKRPLLFRPPMGTKSPSICIETKRANLKTVTWSRRGRDGIGTTRDAVLERLSEHVIGGDVVLLHDGIEPNAMRDPSATIAAVGPLITRLRDRGLVPVRLDELLNLPAYAPATASTTS